jgi:MFS family permease
MLARIYPKEYENSSARSNVSSIAFAGTVIGQLLFGYIADRYTRKLAMTVSAGILILMAALCTASYGAKGSVEGLITMLVVCRFFLGIGIGGEYPAGSVAAAEATSEVKSGTRNRWFILFTNFAIDVGFVVAAFVPLVFVWILGQSRHALMINVSPPRGENVREREVSTNDYCSGVFLSASELSHHSHSSFCVCVLKSPSRPRRIPWQTPKPPTGYASSTTGSVFSSSVRSGSSTM